jgi:hypothetical protein
MRRRHVETKLFYQPRQTWRLALGEIQDQPRERRSVDDRVL